MRNKYVSTSFVATYCIHNLSICLARVVSTGNETPNGLLLKEDKVPSRTTLWRAKKAREAAAAEDYDNVGPPADDIGESDIQDIGDAANDDVSVGMGAGSSGV